jgi:hypothetical protein
MNEYPEMIYGWCASRIIHFIVILQLEYPEASIFMAKYDYSDADIRMAHSTQAAAMSIAILMGVAYIAIRLTFGGSSNPPSWCIFSEIVTDISNEISSCSSYDPSLLRSPTQPHTPGPKLSSTGVPLAKAMPMAVQIPLKKHTTRVDGFIDDLINVFLDTTVNRAREPHIVPLAMHCTSHPHAGDDEHISRRGILSAPKLVAEGAPAETQIVLGWKMDTHRLLIQLPYDKYDAWILELEMIGRSHEMAFKDLD